MTWSWRLIQIVPASTSIGSNWSHGSGGGTRGPAAAGASVPSTSLRAILPERAANSCRRSAMKSPSGVGRREFGSRELRSLEHDGQLTAIPPRPVNGSAQDTGRLPLRFERGLVRFGGGRLIGSRLNHAAFCRCVQGLLLRRPGAIDERPLHGQIQTDGTDEDGRASGKEQFEEVSLWRRGEEDRGKGIEEIQELHVDQIDGIAQHSEHGEAAERENPPEERDAQRHAADEKTVREREG